MHVIRQVVIPDQAHIKYEKLINDEGSIIKPDDLLHPIGLYPLSKESDLQMYLSNKKALLPAAIEDDPTTSIWISYDRLNDYEAGIPFVDDYYNVRSMSTDEELLLLYVGIDADENGEIMVDENLIPVIVAYMKYKFADRIMFKKFISPRMTRGGDGNYVIGLQREYGRLLANYNAELRHREYQNYKRNS